MLPLPHSRVLKFALVGTIGSIVQLGSLAMFSKITMGYLAATGLAVECAVLHNFIWHWRFTWSDRTIGGAVSICASLFRFHLSNGLISLVGNLLLMRVFVGSLGIAVLPANILAISGCFVANFLACEWWAFASRPALARLSGRTVACSNACARGHGSPLPHQQKRALCEWTVHQSCGCRKR
jgi:dolichol-phosphate mannosyltransferase